MRNGFYARPRPTYLADDMRFGHVSGPLPDTCPIVPWERPRGLAATADDGALNEPTGREVVNVIKVRSVAPVLISRRPRRPVRWSVLALTAALAPGALLP